MGQIKIRNLDELAGFAKDLTLNLKPAAVVALAGVLGAGKTTLAQMVATILGVKTGVVSPTFSVFKVYPVAGQQFHQFCHIDLYRLDDFSRRHGFEEYIGDPDTICLIEWAEKIKSRLPPGTIWITVKVLPHNQRLITVAR